MERLRRTGEACLWLLLIGAAVIGALWLAARLRLVVLPVLLALVLTTLLTPPADVLRRRGLPDGLAALIAVVGAILVLGGVLTLIAPSAIEDFQELDVGITGGLNEIQRWLTDGPLDLSDRQLSQAIDNAQESLRSNLDALSRGIAGGAVLVAEVLTGLVLALVLLFFFLKDGRDIWAWVSDLAPPARRDLVRRAGASAWAALAGFLRGQTIVALFDAIFIGLALLIIGVPLVLPLAVLTFFGAYVPILGATLAGAAAALVALFAGGPIDAALVLGAILLVQQIEGNVLQPYVVGRSTHVHPIAVLLAVTAGGVLAGIIGVMVAAPAIAVAAALLRTLRAAGDAPTEAPPPSPEGSDRSPPASRT